MKLEPIIKDTVTLANSEIKKIADRVANTAILAAEKVSVDPSFKAEKDSFESIMLQRLKTFDQTKIKNIQKEVTPLAKASQEVRSGVYGDLGKINIFDVKNVEAAVNKLEPLKIERKLLGLRTVPKNLNLSDVEIKKYLEGQSEILNTHNITSIDAITGGGRLFSDIGQISEDENTQLDDFQPQAVTDKLALYIRRVKCVDETGRASIFDPEGEYYGDDEIALAGTSVDETGDTKKIPEFRVGNSFNDGDTKWYSPHKQWHWFSMREGGSNWPKSYYLTFILAEKDFNGLSDFLQLLWDKVGKSVTEAVATAVGGAVGSALGPLGAVIGAAIGYAVAKVIEWFIKLWKDDIFPPKTISCTVPSYGARWTKNGTWGYTTSSYRTAHFYGHNGHYYIEYYWRLFS
ncbi:hypothetical protein Q4566_14750 [Tamlana sp. 2_MG-2023]|uniref:glycine zipper family protein n=1 Tax=unclassified Tamlana TaxID=2614803 RepID=UPI0026E2BCC2|nr:MULTISPECIES: hypothetical protein [unclassified Tamlana]MDO6761468.1 hypothetical protein [Tamlana sp. 2_MG-2023]MDO6792357.1 hypothetical protein [Tamlana sp. 1_MG-2023]